MPAPAIEFGGARRADRGSYLDLVVRNLGPVDYLLGMEVRAPREMDRAFRGAGYAFLRFLGLLHRSPVTFFAARAGGKVVGTTIVLYLRESGYVAAVGTEASHRKQGVATRLLDIAEGSIRRRHRPWAVLDVECENASAYRLYRARGYQILQTVGWYRRKTSGPGQRSAIPGTVRPVTTREELKAATAWCTANTPEKLRRVLPPPRGCLSGTELTSLPQWSENATWIAGDGGGTRGYARAYRSGAGDPGFLFLPALSAGIPPSEVYGLTSSALDWLARSSTREIVAPVPDYLAPTVPALESNGFEKVLDTYTMARAL